MFASSKRSSVLVRNNSICIVVINNNSKKGHLFCKECIYEYLLEKKKEIQRQLEIYEDQQKKIRVHN